MADTNQVAAYLAEISIRSIEAETATHPKLLDRAQVWLNSAEDVPRLLAVVKAVLDLHKISSDGGSDPHCLACSAAVSWSYLVSPERCDIRLAISRALLGEGESGG